MVQQNTVPLNGLIMLTSCHPTINYFNLLLRSWKGVEKMCGLNESSRYNGSKLLISHSVLKCDIFFKQW